MSELTQLIELNGRVGQFYFSPDTMRFFDSRICRTSYRVIKDKIFFVTSERPPRQERRYTIRVGNLKTGRVESYSEFLKYKTLAAALLAMKKIAA